MDVDNEEIIYEIDNILLTISSEQIGKGKLIITNRGVHWNNYENDDKRVFQFVDIFTHAISNKSIFAQIQNNNNEDEYYYVFFTPEDENQIQSLFDSFSKGSSLCPSPEQEERDLTVEINEDQNDNKDDEIWEDGMNIED